MFKRSMQVHLQPRRTGVMITHTWVSEVSEELSRLFSALGLQHFAHHQPISGKGQLQSSFEAKESGVLVDTGLNMSQQCALPTKNASSILGCFRQSIASRSKEVILSICSALVRLPLNYCLQIWAPQCKRDVGILKTVQRRAAKVMKRLDGLRGLRLSSLERTREGISPLFVNF